MVGPLKRGTGQVRRGAVTSYVYTAGSIDGDAISGVRTASAEIRTVNQTAGWTQLGGKCILCSQKFGLHRSPCGEGGRRGGPGHIGSAVRVDRNAICAVITFSAQISAVDETVTR